MLKRFTKSNLWNSTMQSLRTGRAQHVAAFVLPDKASPRPAFLIETSQGTTYIYGWFRLSLTNPCTRNDLSVDVATSLHQSFSSLCSAQAQFTNFRMLTFECSRSNHSQYHARLPVRVSECSHSVRRCRLQGPCVETERTATMKRHFNYFAFERIGTSHSTVQLSSQRA